MGREGLPGHTPRGHRPHPRPDGGYGEKELQEVVGVGDRGSVARPRGVPLRVADLHHFMHRRAGPQRDMASGEEV